MGWVWNVMLSFDNEELWEEGQEKPRRTCGALDRINAWLPHGRLVDLVGVTFEGDVGYGMDANLYGGGFKHLNMDEFIEVVRAQRWKMRSKVQLWVKGAEEGMGTDPFSLIKLGPVPPTLPAKITTTRKPRAAGVVNAEGKKPRSAVQKTTSAPKPRRG